jgi:hypothetical protein
MTNILKKNKKENEIPKRKYKLKKTKNLIVGGDDYPDVGPFEPVILKNKTYKEKKELLDEDIKKKEQYEKKYRDTFEKYKTDQKEALDRRKNDLTEKINKKKEANIQARHDEKFEQQRYENEKKDARGSVNFLFRWLTNLILALVYFIKYIIGGIWLLFKFSFLQIKSLGNVSRITIGNIFKNSGNIIAFFTRVFMSMTKGAYSVGTYLFSYLASFGKYVGDKIASTTHSTSQFIAKAANGPVVVVIIKYVLLILFILLILGFGLSLFGLDEPTFPSLNKYNPFGDYGYSLFKDKFDYYIGNPLRKSLDMVNGDLSAYNNDMIGGGGIADLLQYNPSMGKIPQFNGDTEWTIFNFPWKFLDMILPKNIFNNLMVNYKSLENRLTFVLTGKNKELENIKNDNRPLLEEGRADNIYNIDLDVALKSNNSRGKLSIIDDYDSKILDNNKKISPDLIEPVNENKKMAFSIGKPKNIQFQLNPAKYMNLDYNNLPESIKNYKFDNDTLSLKDKLNITVPYIEVNGIYKLSFDAAYYTNDITKTPIKNSLSTNIFTDFNYLKANVNEINLTNYDEKTNKKGEIYNELIYTIND